MANIKCQIKRNKQNEKRTSATRPSRRGLKTAVRKFREAAEAGDKDAGRRARPRRRPQARQGRLQGRHPQEPGRQPQVGDRQEGRLALTAPSAACPELVEATRRTPATGRAHFLSRSSGSRRPATVSTSRSSVYDASLAAPLMSASAWATARIARRQPRVGPAAGLVADGAQLPRRHPHLAGQVGVALSPRGAAVAGQPAGAAGERRGDQHRRGAGVQRPAQLLEGGLAAAGERGVGDRERLGLRTAAEVALHLVDASASRRGKSLASWSAAAASDRRSWPTAWTRHVGGLRVDRGAVAADLGGRRTPGSPTP